MKVRVLPLNKTPDAQGNWHFEGDEFEVESLESLGLFASTVEPTEKSETVKPQRKSKESE